jgi:hypothetical protein
MVYRNCVPVTILTSIIIPLSGGLFLSLPVLSSSLFGGCSAFPVWIFIFCHFSAVSGVTTFFSAIYSIQKRYLVFRDNKFFFTLWTDKSSFGSFGPIKIGAFLRTSILNPALESSHFLTTLFAIPRCLSAMFRMFSSWSRKLTSKRPCAFPGTKSPLSASVTFKVFSAPFSNMFYGMFTKTRHVLCILFPGDKMGADRQRNGTCQRFMTPLKPCGIISSERALA